MADVWLCQNSISDHDDELDLVCDAPIAFVHNTFRSFVAGWEYLRVRPDRTMNTNLENPVPSYLFGHMTLLRYVICEKCLGNVGFLYLGNYHLFLVRKRSDKDPLYVQVYDSDSELNYSESENENDSGNFELNRREFMRSHYYS